MDTKWSRRFFSLAELVASWSKDLSTSVGCVIVDSDKRIVSLGFNGPPRGVSDVYDSREQKLRRTIHAEANALHFAGRDVTGCTMFVTHPPCAHCAAHIIQRGISKVIYACPGQGFIDRWREDYYEALDMFREAGVDAVEVDWSGVEMLEDTKLWF